MDVKTHKTISQRSVALLLVALAIVLGIMACALSPIFVLKDVSIKGNTFITDDDIIRIANITKGENLLQLQTDEIKKTLVKDLRIENAVVQREFPSKLDIIITERVPLALVKCDYGYLELGRGGVVLAAHRTLQTMPVPVVTNTMVSGLFVGDVIEDENLKKVLDFLAQLDIDTVSNLSEINIQDVNNILIYGTGAVQIKIGALNELSSKIEITESVIKELHIAKYPIEYVDARFDVYSIKLRQ